MKIINTVTGDVVADIIGGGNLTLDEALELMGAVENEYGEFELNGECHYWDDLDYIDDDAWQTDPVYCPITVKMADGSKKTLRYCVLCNDLGFNPFVQFVAVTTAQTISFTAGRLSEIKALKAAAEAKGYKISKKLSKF